MPSNTHQHKAHDEENREASASIKAELTQIHQQLDTLNQHKFVRAYNSTPRLLWFQFLRGMAFGLGSVIGATIIVSLAISLLSQVEFIPIIGEWAHLIIEEIQSSTSP